jgi:hypothetical protein
MRARVTLGVGLPYQTDRVTLAAGLSFCLHKPCKRVSRVTLASESCFIRPTVTGGQTRMASLDYKYYTYEHISLASILNDTRK